MTIAERVAHGAAWLDTHGPENWWRAVDLIRLNVLSLQNNVLGMVYEYARDASLLEDDETHHTLQGWLARATEYGFRVTVRDLSVGWTTSNDAAKDAEQEATQLNAAWVEVVSERNRREKMV